MIPAQESSLIQQINCIYVANKISTNFIWPIKLVFQNLVVLTSGVNYSGATLTMYFPIYSLSLVFPFLGFAMLMTL